MLADRPAALAPISLFLSAACCHAALGSVGVFAIVLTSPVAIQAIRAAFLFTLRAGVLLWSLAASQLATLRCLAASIHEPAHKFHLEIHMTKWVGESMFRQLGVDVSMLLFESPYIVGMPAAAPAVGDKIDIRMGAPDEKHIAATITSVGPDGMAIETADGSKWLLTPRQPNELPIGVIWSGGPSQGWVIRSPA